MTGEDYSIGHGGEFEMKSTATIVETLSDDGSREHNLKNIDHIDQPTHLMESPVSQQNERCNSWKSNLSINRYIPSKQANSSDSNLIHRSNLNMKTDTIMGRRGFNSTIFSDFIQEWSLEYEKAKPSARRLVASKCMEAMYEKGCRFLVTSIHNRDDCSTVTTRSESSSVYIRETDPEKVTEKIIRSFRRCIAQKQRLDQEISTDNDRETSDETNLKEQGRSESWSHERKSKQVSASLHSLGISTALFQRPTFANNDYPVPVSLARTHSLSCPGDDDMDIRNDSYAAAKNQSDVWKSSFFWEPNTICRIDAHMKEHSPTLLEELKNQADQRQLQSLEDQKQYHHAISPETIDARLLMTHTTKNGVARLPIPERSDLSGRHPAQTGLDKGRVCNRDDNNLMSRQCSSSIDSSCFDKESVDHADSDIYVGENKNKMNGNGLYYGRREINSEDFQQQTHYQNVVSDTISPSLNCMKPNQNVDAGVTQNYSSAGNARKVNLATQHQLRSTDYSCSFLPGLLCAQNSLSDGKGATPLYCFESQEQSHEYQKVIQLAHSKHEIGLSSSQTKTSILCNPLSMRSREIISQKTQLPSLVATSNIEEVDSLHPPFSYSVSPEEKMNSYREWLRESYAGSGEVPAIRHKLSLEELSARFEHVERRAENLNKHNLELLERLSKVELQLLRGDRAFSAPKNKPNKTKSPVDKKRKAKEPKDKPKKKLSITKMTIQKLEARQSAKKLSEIGIKDEDKVRAYDNGIDLDKVDMVDTMNEGELQEISGACEQPPSSSQSNITVNPILETKQILHLADTVVEQERKHDEDLEHKQLWEV